jgi:hypothetical protein
MKAIDRRLRRVEENLLLGKMSREKGWPSWSGNDAVVVWKGWKLQGRLRR